MLQKCECQFVCLFVWKSLTASYTIEVYTRMCNHKSGTSTIRVKLVHCHAVGSKVSSIFGIINSAHCSYNVQLITIVPKSTTATVVKLCLQMRAEVSRRPLFKPNQNRKYFFGMFLSDLRRKLWETNKIAMKSFSKTWHSESTLNYKTLIFTLRVFTRNLLTRNHRRNTFRIVFWFDVWPGLKS